MIRQLVTTTRGRRGTRLSRRLSTFGAVLVAVTAGLVGVGQPASAGCGTIYIVNGYTGLVVSAEVGYPGSLNGMLRARSSGVGAWEKFQYCIDQTNDVFTLKSLANNKYVSVEMNYTGTNKYMLRARSATVGPWERFTLRGTPSPWIDGFRANVNGLFVSTEMGYIGSDQYMLRARAGSIGEWEGYLLGPL